MLYPLYELNRLGMEAISALAGVFADAPNPWLRANAALLHRITKPYPKPQFALPGTREVIVAAHPFCNLVHFEREAADDDAKAKAKQKPCVLVCAPLSGHHATLVREMIATLLADHDVYVTDWIDARAVPLAHGTFSLDDYVALLISFIAQLGAPHVIAVCQPAVPALAAVALLAQRGAGAPPRSLTVMGGPIDPRINPTVVDKLATDRPLAWFEQVMIDTVPAPHAGAGRRVYPGFVQLAAFAMMNPDKHARAYYQYWIDCLRGDAAAADAHERFYDEYNAVLDMDAPYYLDTIRTVFQELALARGTWRVGGELVEPRAIARTPIFAIEGAHDDIAGLGQTAAALELASALPAAHKRHLVADVGHYGLFAGRKWRETIYPQLREFVADAERSP